jgi:hypothetical protein
MGVKGPTVHVHGSKERRDVQISTYARKVVSDVEWTNPLKDDAKTYTTPRTDRKRAGR